MAKGKAAHGSKAKRKAKAADSGDATSNKPAKAVAKAMHKKQKGKKYTIDDDSLQAMRKYLANIGCKLNEVEADGNCLFRSLGDQLFGDQTQHEEIRKRIVDYIEVKRSDFEPFMEDEEKFDHYCSRMREDGTWGGNQELYAAARLFAVYIVVHQESNRVVIECDAQKPKSVLHIAYHGSDHYDSIRSIRDPDMNTPPLDIALDIDGLRPDDFVARWRNNLGNTATAASTPIASSSVDGDSVDAAASALASLNLAPSSATGTVILSKKAQRMLRKHERATTRATK